MKSSNHFFQVPPPPDYLTLDRKGITFQKMSILNSALLIKGNNCTSVPAFALSNDT